MDQALDKDQLLIKARALVEQLENQPLEDQAIDNLLDDIAKLRESSLFQELGKMTREIHDSIMNFRMDSRIAELAETDIPDAKDRLEYVITMTENAANTVLGVVENSTPLAEKLNQQAGELAQEWQRFRKREMNAEEQRDLGMALETMFSDSTTMTSELLSGFNEVLMAQDFQDLTGQIIRRVINLVNEIESNLVQLIKIQGEYFKKEEAATGNAETKSAETDLQGPQVPGKESNDVLKGQDDVDDLLASLGF